MNSKKIITHINIDQKLNLHHLIVIVRQLVQVTKDRTLIFNLYFSTFMNFTKHRAKYI